MEGFVIVLCVGIFIFSIWVLLSFEKRIHNRIEKEAKSQKMIITKIREPNSKDGKCPFSSFRIVIGASSNIFGIRGEQRIFKIVVLSDKTKYWVQIDTLFFIPSSVQWKKIEDEKMAKT